MASTTTNLGLTKPAYTDDADVAVINANSDIIDAAYGSLSDQIANYICVLSSSYLAINASDIIPYPTGYTYSNAKVVYSCLRINNQRYYGGAGWVGITDTDGIHVTNVGGAGGYVELGLVKVS